MTRKGAWRRGPRTRRRVESRVARDCVRRGGSSFEGLVCSLCCHLGRHPFARSSREPPRPTQTFGFRRADGHESGLRRTRTNCHFTCLAFRPPRAERSWAMKPRVLAALSRNYTSKDIVHNDNCGRVDVLIRRAAREDTRPPYPRTAWSWGRQSSRLFHFSTFPPFPESRPFCS